MWNIRLHLLDFLLPIFFSLSKNSADLKTDTLAVKDRRHLQVDQDSLGEVSLFGLICGHHCDCWACLLSLLLQLPWNKLSVPQSTCTMRHVLPREAGCSLDSGIFACPKADVQQFAWCMQHLLLMKTVTLRLLLHGPSRYTTAGFRVQVLYSFQASTEVKMKA